MDEADVKALMNRLADLVDEITTLRRQNAMLSGRLHDEQGRLIELRERWGDERTL